MTASPSPTNHPITAEELMALPEQPGVSYELVRGELRFMAPSVALPGVVAAKSLVRVGSFVERHNLGVCGTAESGFKLAANPDTVRAPDLWFVRAERVPAEGIPETFWPGAPDLAVEVLSPSDRFTTVIEKVYDYLNAGSRLVWVIDPPGRSAAIFRPEEPPQLLGEDGVLDGGDLLPGFCLPLREILP
ncbi:MAG: Uma2 family endonuclease [Dehalococcoidia bacterium]